MRAVISWDSLPEIILACRLNRFFRLLRVISHARQVPVGKARRDFIADDRLDRGPADVDFGPVMMRRPDDRFGGDFRLKDRRHRLGLSRQATFHP